MTLGSRAALLALSAMSIRCGGGNPCAITSANVVMAAHAPDADHVTYLVGGDSRGDKAGVVRWAFGQAKAVGARGFLFLGDMEWSYACDTHFRQQQVSYLSPIPFYPVLGNHEIAWFGFLKGKARGVDGALDAERIFQKNFLATPEHPSRRCSRTRWSTPRISRRGFTSSRSTT